MQTKPGQSSCLHGKKLSWQSGWPVFAPAGCAGRAMRWPQCFYVLCAFACLCRAGAATSSTPTGSAVTRLATFHLRGVITALRLLLVVLVSAWQLHRSWVAVESSFLRQRLPRKPLLLNDTERVHWLGSCINLLAMVDSSFLEHRLLGKPLLLNDTERVH